MPDRDQYIEIKAETFKLMRAYSDRSAQSLLSAIKQHFKPNEMDMVKKALIELCDKLMGQ